jgi:hypothetical protein
LARLAWWRKDKTMTVHISQQSSAREPRINSWHWLGPLCFMLVVGIYFVVRYSGNWAEADSSTFTNVIRPVMATGQIVPDKGAVYPNGYAYQVMSVFIVSMTGLDVSTLQQLVYPLTACLLVLPAWMLYREFTGSALGATLTTMLLFTQPEFLFVILRSSHEKFTRTLLLLCFYCLVRSFKLRTQLGPLVIHLCIYYLAIFALIAHNNLLAHSFVLAVAMALALGSLLSKRIPQLKNETSYYIQRLAYGTCAALALVYIFTFYVYLPAQHDLLVIKGLGESVQSMFLGVDAQQTNAYTQVGSAWVAPAATTYFLVSIANWVILGTSLIIWCAQGIKWLWYKQAPRTFGVWLTWLLYAAFATQGALSVVVDASGALGSNLQHRLFPSFSTIAVALVGAALAEWRPRRLANPIRIGLALLVFCISILSIFKATNEPMLSNKWTFYQPAELTALEWTDQHLENASVWTEFDERLWVAYLMKFDGPTNNTLVYGSDPETSWRYMVISDLTRLHAIRLQQTLPTAPDALRIYDNGQAQLYQLRPRTPFQR